MNIKYIFYSFLFFIFPLVFLRAGDEKTLAYLEEAEQAHVEHQIEKAALKSQEALSSIFSNSSITQDQRSAVINDFTNYTIDYVKLLANQRKFENAIKELELILLPNANPNNKEARHLFSYLQNFSNKNTQNIALCSKKSEFEASNKEEEETRSHLLVDIEKDWISRPTLSGLPENRTASFSKQTINKKLESIFLPIVELEDATLDEAITYLKEKSCIADPLKEGINIVVKSFAGDLASSTNSPHLNLELHDIPLATALEYLAQQANCKLEVDSYAVSLVPAPRLTEAFLTREYDVPSSFFSNKELTASSLKNFFQSQGIDFTEGSTATYSASLNKLIVRNTPENLDLIGTLIKSVLESPTLEVSIETKFIEINQNDLSELGFNWLLGSFSLGGSGIDMSGGGSSEGLNTAAYPFPTEGMNPVGALRSGNTAINNTSIDTVIEGNARNVITESSIPGIFSIGGVYSTPQFQMVLRALNQKKGIDLMAAPHVTTKNGTKAIIKIVDEFIYPSEYTPPQLPTSTVATNYNTGLRQIPPTITPSFPNSWTSKNLGVTLEAKPTIAPDQKMISLELHPQITDFDGFINYGTPINTVGYNLTATNMSSTPFSETLTTNTINQPVFTIREVNTSVMVKDGQTVIIGGLIREDIQHVKDKIPFLGDIPLAGRLFRSESERKLKKNLIIFVTPKILNIRKNRMKSEHFDPTCKKPT